MNCHSGSCSGELRRDRAEIGPRLELHDRVCRRRERVRARPQAISAEAHTADRVALLEDRVSSLTATLMRAGVGSPRGSGGRPATRGDGSAGRRDATAATTRSARADGAESIGLERKVSFPPSAKPARPTHATATTHALVSWSRLLPEC